MATPDTTTPAATPAPEPITATLEASATLAAEELAPKEIELGPNVIDFLNLPIAVEGPATAATRSMTFQGKLFAGGTHAATLDEATVTVTRMANPSTGVPFLLITFGYFATSLGWRTGKGSAAGEAGSMLHGLYFKNSAGGTMWSWGFPYDDFRLSCGWNREWRYHVIRDYDYVSWFDLWAGVEHRVHGTMYRC